MITENSEKFGNLIPVKIKGKGMVGFNIEFHSP